VSNNAKNFDLALSLSLTVYFDGPTKLFSDLNLAKLLILQQNRTFRVRLCVYLPNCTETRNEWK